MATLPTLNPTLLDVTKRLDPNGKIDKIAEMLSLTNEVIDDMTWLEGNLPTGHRTTVRTGLPTPTWRNLYGGVQPTKSTTAQITDSCGMLEAYAEVDKALADLNGNTAAFRMSEDAAHIEGMNQEFASTLFYGNESTEPEAFTGFAPRFNSTSAENAINLVSGGGGSGQTDCTSIWLVVWGPNTVHGIYPKGSVAGLQMTDKGQVTVENATGYAAASGGAVGGGRMEAYRTHYRWDCGLTVRDWRYVVRIHSIDTDELEGDYSGNSADICDLLSQAFELIPSMGMGRPVIYANRKVKSYLRRQITKKVGSSTLDMSEVAGKHVLSLDGIHIKRCDSITNAETSLN